MRSWKEAGRADRSAEEELWTRFKTAQDTFFQARAQVLHAKDAELHEHANVKTRLLADAEKLLPVTDARAARATLRGIQERWEQAGSVPRDAHERLEGGLRRVEEAIRRAEDSQWRRSNPEALSRARGTVEQIRSAISQLEGQLSRAQANGDAKAAGAGRGGARGAALMAGRGRAHAGRAFRLSPPDGRASSPDQPRRAGRMAWPAEADWAGGAGACGAASGRGRPPEADTASS